MLDEVKFFVYLQSQIERTIATNYRHNIPIK